MTTPNDNQIYMQRVVIQLSDGRAGMFTGLALLNNGEILLNSLKIANVIFSPPQPLTDEQQKALETQADNLEKELERETESDQGREQTAVHAADSVGSELPEVGRTETPETGEQPVQV
jgi:hypothetical protein